MPAGGSLKPASHDTVDQRLHYVHQDGQTVFKFAVRKTEEICRRLLERNGLVPADIDLLVSHQANRRIIQLASEKLGIDPSRVVINIERFGNTTAGDDSAGARRCAPRRPPAPRSPGHADVGRRRLYGGRGAVALGVGGRAGGTNRSMQARLKTAPRQT